MSASAVSNGSSRNRTPTANLRTFSPQAAAKTLGQLIRDVQLGSLPNAQTDLATLTQQIGLNASTEAESALGRLVAQLGTDLGAGNMGAAQTAVASFNATLADDCAVATTGTLGAGGIGGTTPGRNPAATLMGQISTLVQVSPNGRWGKGGVVTGDLLAGGLGKGTRRA